MEHSWPHYAVGFDPLRDADDAQALSRRGKPTSVLSTRLSANDIVEIINLTYLVNHPLPVRLDMRPVDFDRGGGQNFVRMRFTLPTSADGRTDPLEMAMIVCAQENCEADGLKFRFGDVISIFPKSGPGVVLIPPTSALRAGTRKPIEVRFGSSPLRADEG